MKPSTILISRVQQISLHEPILSQPQLVPPVLSRLLSLPQPVPPVLCRLLSQPQLAPPVLCRLLSQPQPAPLVLCCLQSCPSLSLSLLFYVVSCPSFSLYLLFCDVSCPSFSLFPPFCFVTFVNLFSVAQSNCGYMCCACSKESKLFIFVIINNACIRTCSLLFVFNISLLIMLK